MAGRIVGIDIARFVALAGMMAIHILPAFEDGQVTFSQSLAGGRSAALFAVLAGVSMTVATGGKPVVGARWFAVALGLVARAALIGLLGLALGEVDTTIAVILTYYAVLFVLGAPFLACPTGVLFALAAVWVVLGPVLSHLIRPELPPATGASPSFVFLNEPPRLLEELVFTGTYPAFVWLAYLLAGLAVGRLDLRRWGTAWGLLGVGAALVGAAYAVSDALLDRPGVRERLAENAGGSLESLEVELSGSLHGTTPTDTWWWLAVRSAHSGTPLDLLQTIGSALAVLGVCLLLGLALPRTMSVVFGAGALTLTLYSMHVLSRQPGWWDEETVEVWAGQVLVALAFGALFGLLRLRGPLEWLVSSVSRLFRGEPPRLGFRTEPVRRGG
jgi:hypothetical protein